MVTIKGLKPPALLALMRSARRSVAQPRHVFLCVADHYEPDWGGAGPLQQTARVERWLRQYPRAFANLADSRGRPPQHTFFYPAEAYHQGHLDQLASLCRQGFGEVEVHLHHDNDTEDGLRVTLNDFTQRLADRHGLLKPGPDGRIRYGFIHGNWALCNSHPDGKYCGVRRELSVLRETGCYADFTMPSAPCPTQTRVINQIYYADDSHGHVKAHDRGTRACVHQSPPPGQLLMVQGPLAADWRGRHRRFLPRLENGELSAANPASIQRFRLWISANVHVAGRPDWLFIKLHTHGAKEANANMLLGPPMIQFHQQLAQYAALHQPLDYYYVTAREMVDLIHQAEAGAVQPSFC